MRSLVLQMGTSLDGYVAGPTGAHDWAFRGGEHPDVTAWKVASLRRAGTHIMGRVTYEEMAAVWPTASGDYAEVMNAVPKVVFSATVESADWPDTRIARGDLAQEIDKLKAEPGGDIIAHGGAGFAAALAHLGLVDEYRLIVRPVVLGAGMPLFKDLPMPLHLDIVEAHTYRDGVAIHVCRPVATGKEHTMTTQTNHTTSITAGTLDGIPAGTWTIDPAHSSAGFTIRHLMSKVRGSFDEFQGTITIAEDLSESTAAATISIASVNTGIEMRDQDLRSPHFFDAEQFPSMAFEGTGLDLSGSEPSLIGELTIKQVTHPVRITLEFLGFDETGLQGEPRIGFSGQTTLRRSDFGVGGAIGNGAKIVVADTLTVQLDIEAFRD